MMGPLLKYGWRSEELDDGGDGWCVLHVGDRWIDGWCSCNRWSMWIQHDVYSHLHNVTPEKERAQMIWRASPKIQSLILSGDAALKLASMHY